MHPKLDDIEAVHLGVSLLGPRELVSHCPQNAVEAKFSMEFALASRLVYQRTGIEEFTDDKVLDARIQALMKKMTMEIDPDLASWFHRHSARSNSHKNQIRRRMSGQRSR